MDRKIPLGLFIFVFLTLSNGESAGGEYRVVPSAAFQQKYDDNVFFDIDNEARSDYITTISPAIALIDKTERLDIHLSAQADRNLYADNDDLDCTDNFYTGEARYRFSPNVKISSEAHYTKDSNTDRDFEQTGLVKERVTCKTHQYLFSGDWLLNENTTGLFASTYDRGEFNNPDFDDYIGSGVNIGLKYDLSRFIPSASGLMNFMCHQYDYTKSAGNMIPMTGIESALHNYKWSVGVSLALNEIITIFVEAGARFTDSQFTVRQLSSSNYSDDKLRNDDEGFVGLAKASFSGEYCSSSISLTRDIYNAPGESGLTERTSLICDISQRKMETFGYGVSAGYFLNKADRYILAYNKLDENSIWFSPWVCWYFGKDIDFLASYSLGQLNDKEEDTKRVRNTFLINLRCQHPLFE